MNKATKIGLSVVASALITTSAFAGTEGCIEISKGAVLAAPLGIYADPECSAIEGNNSGEEVKIAYELTKNAYPLNLNDIDGAGADQAIVYIPTTDIPGGTLIEVSLTNAYWSNTGTVYMLKEDFTQPLGDELTSVGSSDGATGGATLQTIKFITKSGVTISAGTRIILSSIDGDSDGAAGGTAINGGGYANLKMSFSNEVCTTGNSVQIQVTTATTDGGTGYSILGGITGDAVTSVLTPKQFSIAMTPVDSTVPVSEVDVQNPSLRTLFVAEPSAAQLDETTLTQTTYAATFTNEAATTLATHKFDDYITLNSNDDVEMDFTSTITGGVSNVVLGLYDNYTEGTAASDSLFVSNSLKQLNEAATAVDQDYLLNGTTYSFDAETLFLANNNGDALGATSRTLYFLVYNNDTNEIMDYNYKVTTGYAIDFNSGDEIDLCRTTALTHNVGINGAILKAPYLYSNPADINSYGFVRITNEYSQAADIYMDVWDEADLTAGAAGNLVTNVSLNKIGANSSRTIFVADMLGALDSAGNPVEDSLTNLTVANVSGRFSATFVVTSPKEQVYGTSVMGNSGQDRVMPLKDNSGFAQ